MSEKQRRLKKFISSENPRLCQKCGYTSDILSTIRHVCGYHFKFDHSPPRPLKVPEQMEIDSESSLSDMEIPDSSSESESTSSDDDIQDKKKVQVQAKVEGKATFRFKNQIWIEIEKSKVEGKATFGSQIAKKVVLYEPGVAASTSAGRSRAAGVSSGRSRVAATSSGRSRSTTSSGRSRSTIVASASRSCFSTPTNAKEP